MGLVGAVVLGGQRGDAPGDRDRARDLLTLALADARRLGIPEAGQIEDIIQQHNLQPKA